MDELRNDNGDGMATPAINPGYAGFQLAKALLTAESHDDPETSERARQKAGKWRMILSGLLSGKLGVGSRTPVADVPSWATLEVMMGGFATGHLLAAGPLLDHERRMVGASAPPSQTRRMINEYCLSSEGVADLVEMLESGRYDVSVPEEGAMPVIAWLVRNGRDEAAEKLAGTLAPWFPKLRFYPIPARHTRPSGSGVFVQDVKSTVASLRRIAPSRAFLAQREAVTIWGPIYDRMIALFLDTVDGEPPVVRTGPDGAWLRADNGRFVVEGGWPCRRYPGGWRERATALLEEFDAARAEHHLCGRPVRAKDSFGQLRDYIGRCAHDPTSLNGRDVGRIRLILGRHIARRGVPGSAQSNAFRAGQSAQSSGPMYPELASELARRLEAYPPDGGIPDIEAIVQPITAQGSAGAPESGWSIPYYLRRKVERSLHAAPQVLIERGLISSGEVLARVLPEMTSEIHAAGLDDPTLRELYRAIYTAFRRRRSLLLLNLEKQVGIGELPWVAAIERFRRDDGEVRDTARRVLGEIASLAIVAFPHTILPNKLVRELSALAVTAGLDLPFIEEVAADIFMGRFSNKFPDAARRGGTLLGGSLYARYYGIDYREIVEGGVRRKGEDWTSRSGLTFARLCEMRAGVGHARKPAINGMIIEQQQILTTQNLAVLFSDIGLSGVVGAQAGQLAMRCFTWICRRQQIPSDNWRGRLRALKNCAYAWRQMIFFLAIAPDETTREFLRLAEEHLGRQSPEFQTRFHPALAGLALVADGGSLDDDGNPGARRFTGWAATRHWLL